MGIVTLEREFEVFQWQHKLNILKALMIRYYEDLQNTNTTCLSDETKKYTPEQLAEKEVNELLMRDDEGFKFTSLYNNAWDILKEYLP